MNITLSFSIGGIFTMFTTERFFSSMCKNMSLQISGIFHYSWAIRTTILFGSKMNRGVLQLIFKAILEKQPFLIKTFLFLFDKMSGMCWYMLIHIILSNRSVFTKVTTEWFHPSIDHDMPFHIRRIFHFLWTIWTSKMVGSNVNHIFL